MNNQTANQQPTAKNDLRFTTSKTIGKETIYVKIRLNDECKNGHQDFSITGDIYEAGKPKTDRYFISGGCIHEDILKHFPEFKIFVDLHLCDYKGIPMYAVENGYYHLREGFNKTKPNDAGFKTEFCEYYRLSLAQFDELSKSRCKTEFALMLQSLNILDQWETQAKEAIKILESLTGSTFVVDSKRTQYNAPSKEEVEDFTAKVMEGYYTQESILARQIEAKEKKKQEMENDFNKKVAQMRAKLEINKQLFDLGGEKFKSGVIYYTHSNQLKFNWSSEKLTPEEIETIKANLVLPEGATYQN
jgi:hypothetical protein